MKKKNFLMLPCIAAVAIATFVGKKTFESHVYETSSLLMQNVEALSQQNEDVTICPDFNYVPDHYLQESQPTIVVSTCTTKGEIKVGESTLSGEWEKDKTYTFIVTTKNCDGEAHGTCCDQRKVGTEIKKAK